MVALLTSIKFFALVTMLRALDFEPDTRGDVEGEQYNMTLWVREFAGYPIRGIKALRVHGGGVTLKEARDLWVQARGLVDPSDYTRWGIANATEKGDWATVSWLATRAIQQGVE